MSDLQAFGVAILCAVLFAAIVKTILDLTKNQDGSNFF